LLTDIWFFDKKSLVESHQVRFLWTCFYVDNIESVLSCSLSPLWLTNSAFKFICWSLVQEIMKIQSSGLVCPRLDWNPKPYCSSDVNDSDCYYWLNLTQTQSTLLLLQLMHRIIKIIGMLETKFRQLLWHVSVQAGTKTCRSSCRNFNCF
jgi:hypothetical protein